MAKSASKVSKAHKARKSKKGAVRTAGRAGKKQAKSRAPQKVARCSRGSFAGLPLRQLVAKLRAHLGAHGFAPVLTGRACAAIYAGSAIKPRAIDFVVDEYSVNQLDDAMNEVGFADAGGHTYTNKRCPLDVVFLPPPLAVGDDIVRQVAALRTREGPILILSPTDSVRERLAAYYQWGDREALAEALQVARRHEVDLALVKRWSEHEWFADRYAEFVGMLQET
jgi:hypothetical protein